MTGAATKLNKHFEKGIFLCASLWQWTSNVTSLEGAHDEWTRFIAIAWLRLMYGKGTHLNINEEKRIYSFCEEVMDLFKNATSTICFGRNPSTLSYRRRRVGRFFFFFFSIFGALKQTWRIFQRPVNTVNLPHSTHSMFSCAYVKICWHIAFVSIHIDISTSSNEFELCWCVSAVVKLNASRHNLNHTEINVIYYASQRLDLIWIRAKRRKSRVLFKLHYLCGCVVFAWVIIVLPPLKMLEKHRETIVSTNVHFGVLVIMTISKWITMRSRRFSFDRSVSNERLIFGSIRLCTNGIANATRACTHVCTQHKLTDLFLNYLSFVGGKCDEN